MLPPGHVIDGKYSVVRVIGRGGMGIVYEGLYTRIQRRVAVKVLHAEVAAKPEMVQRFEREAQVAGRIGSEHVVEVLDAGGLASGERFIVMEYLEGETLGERLKARERLGELETALLLRQILVALAAAHRAGVVHRDIKPDNVFLVAERANVRDFVKLVDFGVSKFLPDEELSMTKSGAVMGTPYYMSPEQARGQQVTPSSDFYSACVVAYQAVSGQVPFLSKSFNELLFKIALEEPPPIAALVPAIDPAFAALIMRGLERDPANRYEDAAAFLEALDAWIAARPAGEHRASRGSLPAPASLSPAFMSSSMHQKLPAFVSAPRARSALPAQYSPVRDTLATSHSALAVTSGGRSSSHLLVASVVCVAALAGVGIAVFGYRVTGTHAGASAAPSAAAATQRPATGAEITSAATAIAPLTASPPPTTVSDDSVVTLEASPDAIAADTASAEKAGRGARSGKAAPAKSAAVTPADAPTAKPGRGRIIDGSL